MIMKGQKISDRYQIVKSIGEGGMANVYLAFDTILERNVAIKILRGDLATDEKFVRRFQREALAASSLTHQNIVEVYDVGEDNGEYYIVMEYIEGKQLKQLLKKRGKLTLSEVVDIMGQITDGMSAAHDSYIIHRDIKPQNIMILENGMIKITDFGIAMALNSTQLTQTNSVMGSVHYLPPEQANGKGATLKSDIYSMGILMYELLTGKLPYRGDTAVEVALKHLKEPLPSIREELPDLPQSIENIIIKSTAKNPKNRYNDAREMHNDLMTCLDESRLNEKPYKLPYPELDNEDKKLVVKKENKEEVVKDNNDEVIATKIEKPSESKSNKLLIILASIFTGLIVIITLIIVGIFIFNSRKEIIVPDVSGMSVSKAIKTLQDAGFTVNDVQKEKSSETIEEGKVILTSPAAGTKKTQKSEVTLTISIGDARLTVEDYTGRTCSVVKDELWLKLNIYVTCQSKEIDENSNYKDDEVIGQEQEPGTQLSSGDQLILYVPEATTVIPDFKSYSQAEIEQFCNEHEITCKFKEVITTEYEPGTIISQNRQPGEPVYKGVTNITISVAISESTPIDNDSDGDGIEDNYN